MQNPHKKAYQSKYTEKNEWKNVSVRYGLEHSAHSRRANSVNTTFNNGILLNTPAHDFTPHTSA